MNSLIGSAWAALRGGQRPVSTKLRPTVAMASPDASARLAARLAEAKPLAERLHFAACVMPQTLLKSRL